MSAPIVYTYYDAIVALEEFGRGHAFSATQSAIRRAIQAAYREIVAVRDWRWLYKEGRIQLQAPYTTGTVAYVHTGSTYEREVTLTGGTWPTWIQDACVRFNSVVSIVESRKSDTVITLDVQRNPGADVAAGTTFSAYRRWYPLPNDFVALWAPQENTSWLLASYRPAQDLAALDRYDDSTGDVNYYAIGPGEGLYGADVLYVNRPSDATETLDIPYKRMPRSLRYSGHDAADWAGTITVTAGSATVACTGTSADDSVVGAVVRIGTDTNRPTGVEGLHPYGEQRVIIDTTGGSTGTWTLDAVVATSRTGVSYVISDPIDLPFMVYEAFLRCAEKNLASSYRKAIDPATRREILDEYGRALERAKWADGGAVKQRRVCGSVVNYGGTQLENSTPGETLE